MLATAIILFREVLEIAIILTIILAATRGLPRRGAYVLAGITAGIAGAALVALFAEQIADALAGQGQEVFNAAILLIAVGMIAWTVVWMKTHGREMARKIKSIGAAVREGELPLRAIAVVVALSMWREGAEIVLFLFGQAASGQAPLGELLLGGALGGGAAAAIGVLMYFGLVQLSTRHLFSVTGWLLVFLACGLSAQAAQFLEQAGYLPELVNPLWDTSRFLSDDTLLARVLHSMLGYTAQPTGMQVLWYAGTFGIICTMLAWQNLRRKPMPIPA